MLVSLKWLRDYVDIDMPAGQLAECLTMAGLEVDTVEEKRPDFSGVVVAKIVKIEPHPDADKLVVCGVSTGDRSCLVVCGARNINVGDIVPLATVGARIPGGYTIKLSKIRGVTSEGMLCSEDELGLGPDATGIMILPQNLALGADLADALDLKDTVLDVGVTPNRPDCLCMIGIAREVAAVAGKKLRYPQINVSESDEDISHLTSVEILDPDLCPRYAARIVKNVSIKPSPLWMRLRLESVGLRAINNAVDVTNFVMMEMNQPMHAFDFRFLEGGRIVVRRSNSGEIFVSLDEKERILKEDTLMICDAKKPVAIGGIMGGLNSEVKDDTNTILLESAYFNPVSIRRSSKWLQMSTDAAFRFERGIDPFGQVRALDRAALLLSDISGGTICRNVIDECPAPIKSAVHIPLRMKKIRGILGADITGDEVEKTLGSIEMNVEKAPGEGLYHVIPPTFRVDISREIDLIEEVARLHGFEKIPVTMPTIRAQLTASKGGEHFFDKIAGILNGCGYSEVINYSFVSPKAADILQLDAHDRRRKTVRISNPLTEDQSVMRTSMAYSLLESMRRNANAGCFNLKFFELGRIYLYSEKDVLPDERATLACLLTGSRYDESWHFDNVEADFYDLKGVLENLFDELRIAVDFDADAKESFLHPGRSSSLSIGTQRIGFIGEVHPNVLEAMDLKNHAFYCEIDIDRIVPHCRDNAVFKEISRYPAVVRDAAFLADKKIEAHAVVSAVMQTGEELLEKVSIFDVYHGQGIAEGKKSLALRFSYRASDRTLTDDEVNQAHSRMIETVIARTGASVRGA